MSGENKNLIRQILILIVFICLLFNRINIFEVAKSINSVQKKIVHQKIFSFIAKTKNFLCYESETAIVYFTLKDKEFIPLISGIVDTYYPLLAKDFNMDNYPKAVLVIYPEETSLKKATNTKYEKMPLGIYYGGVLNILSPLAYSKNEPEIAIKNKFWEQGPIIHELSHFLLDIKTQGNFDIWFAEGVSLFYEYKYMNFELSNSLKESSKEISLYELKHKFTSLDENKSYRRSFDIINDYVNKYSEKNLTLIYEQLADGRKIKIKNK